MAEIEILESALRSRELTEGEMAVLTYIQEGLSSEEVLRRDQSWEAFYHFAPMRQSLFNWYPFEKHTRLLELGCETGILTSFFCESCGEVTVFDRNVEFARAAYRRNKHCRNLKVYAGDVRECPEDACFDYVILQPAYYQEQLGAFLAYARSVLKPNGHLLLVVKNKLGVDVLCGKTNGAEMPYEAFNMPRNAYCSREEVENMLQERGYLKHKYFYPLPDAVIPQEIYSEIHMPQGKRADRTLQYYPRKDTLLMPPESLLSEVIGNGMFHKCANFFVLDCCVQAEPSDISYVALSTDRKRDAAYATRIHQGGYVDKAALFPEGKAGVERLASNSLELENRGIAMVAQEVSADGKMLRMPYVKEELLITRIGQVSEEREKLQEIFDALYEAILKSSQHIPEEKNNMREYGPAADWGVILEKAYIDMIPLNCFWNNGKLLFFDQEFARMECPAKYVLFRALRYTFLSLDSEGKAFDLDFFTRRYGLEELWQFFLTEEDKFIYENRNHELYGNFYNWVRLEANNIPGNVDRLLQKIPVSAGSRETCEEMDWLFSEAFYERESDDCGFWRWACEGAAEFILQGREDRPENWELELEIVLPDPSDVKRAEIYIDNKYWGHFVVPNKIVIPLRLGKAERKKVAVRGNFAEKTFPGDARKFYFQLRNYSIRREPVYVSRLIQDVREVQVEILKDLKKVCEEYGLHYFAMYGTLLGIVRNEDYIPWDDDIDVAMPRKDYDRLLELSGEQGVFGDKLFLQNMYNDTQCFFGGYSKLRMNGTLGITRANRGRNCHNGIWIDIFPVDNRIRDVHKLCRQHRKILFYQRLLFHKVYGRGGLYNTCNPWSQRYFCAAKILNYGFLCRGLDRAIQQYNTEETAKQSIFARMMALASIPAFPRECFDRTGTGKFHGIEVSIPIVAEECLNVIWGYNYMLYPGEEARKPHEDVYYSLEQE